MDACKSCIHVLMRDMIYGGHVYTMYHCDILKDTLTVCDMKKVEHEILVRKSVRPSDVCDLYEENDETRTTTD